MRCLDSHFIHRYIWWTIAAEKGTTSAKSEQERKEAATQRNGKETTRTRDPFTRTTRGKRRLQFTKEPAKWTNQLFKI